MTAAVQPDRRGAERAYEAIAPVYDEFTAHHDYELWLGHVLPELRRHGLRQSRLLDVGCGTGKSFLPMLRRGWDVVACDVSPAMLELARAKAGDAVKLSVADMRKLPVFGEFELVWALDDPINYLLDVDELGARDHVQEDRRRPAYITANGPDLRPRPRQCPKLIQSCRARVATGVEATGILPLLLA